jgi:FRG domain
LLQAEPWLRGSPERLEDEVQGYETQLLYNARLAGHGHHEGRQLGDLELLAMLQHHGAATRLLDFTENLLVAAWFACQAHVEGFGLLLGVDLSEAWSIDDPEWLGRRLVVYNHAEVIPAAAEREP